MDMNYKINNNILNVNNSNITFEYNIADVKIFENILIVRLEIPFENAKENKGFDNIYGININGDIIWRIEKPIVAFNLDESSQGYDYYFKSIYTEMNIGNENNFYVYTFSMCYIINPQTGKIIGEKQVQ